MGDSSRQQDEPSSLQDNENRILEDPAGNHNDAEHECNQDDDDIDEDDAQEEEESEMSSSSPPENEEERGQKRPLEEEEEDNDKDPAVTTTANNTSLGAGLASTETRDLPDGVTIIPSPKPSNDSPSSTTSGWIVTIDSPTTTEDTMTTTPKITTFCLVGRAKIQCLKGQVEILGHVLTPATSSSEDKDDDSDKIISVSSPYWSSWLTMEVSTASFPTQLQITSIRGNPFSFRLTNPIRPTIIPPTWRSAVQRILHDMENQSTQNKPVRASSSLEDDDDDDNVVRYIRAHETIVMIAGAKGVGKSTFLRYATNRLLQQNKHVSGVAILDADVGQPELAPPGLLSLKIVSRGKKKNHPLLHPPYWNLCDNNPHRDDDEAIETIQSVFFGAVTSKVDPTRYLQAVERLIAKYRDYMSRSNEGLSIPLLVNLDGWIKGMGYQILSSLISTTRPSHICQLVGDSKAKAFDLTQAVVEQNDNPENLGNPANEFIRNPNPAPIQHFVLDVCSKFVTPFTIPSVSLRTIRLCAYFGPHLEALWDSLDFLPAKELQTGWTGGDPECTLAWYLAKERPYCVPCEAVELVHSNESIHMELMRPLMAVDNTSSSLPSQLMLQAMNGCIVGLCTQGQEDCLGLGIVRSIDWERQLLFILTPVATEELPRVRVLVGGNIPLPSPMVFRGVHAESFPYLAMAKKTTSSNSGNDEGDASNTNSIPQKILGSEPMKSRNNIGRRSFAGPTKK